MSSQSQMETRDAKIPATSGVFHYSNRLPRPVNKKYRSVQDWGKGWLKGKERLTHKLNFGHNYLTSPNPNIALTSQYKIYTVDCSHTFFYKWKKRPVGWLWFRGIIRIFCTALRIWIGIHFQGILPDGWTGSLCSTVWLKPRVQTESSDPVVQLWKMPRIANRWRQPWMGFATTTARESGHFNGEERSWSTMP